MQLNVEYSTGRFKNVRIIVHYYDNVKKYYVKKPAK